MAAKKKPKADPRIAALGNSVKAVLAREPIPHHAPQGHFVIGVPRASCSTA